MEKEVVLLALVVTKRDAIKKLDCRQNYLLKKKQMAQKK